MSDGFKLMYVEDDASIRFHVTETLELAGFEVEAFADAERALQHITPGFRGIVVSDVRLPGMDGLELLRSVVKIDRTIPMILVTGHGDISMAVHAMQEGAYDFLEKPFAMERLVDVSRRAMEKRMLSAEIDVLRRQLSSKSSIDAVLLGNSPAMKTVRRQILSLAELKADVLIMGETGTGKEMVARCLHDYSERSSANFVAINCGALPETLFESEIFGHEPGAYTGAGKRRVGKIEYANGGTILLDEIESMPLAFQVKLLRALQERKIERLGSNEEIPVDFRVVAATKVDLKTMSDQQKFRSDLYYRLNVAVIELPPLRERREDIPLLFEHFVLQAAARYRRTFSPVQDHHMRALMANDWPGNVRELRNVADRYVLDLLRPSDRLADMTESDSMTLPQQMDFIEKALIEQALKRHHGRATEVCESLGIGKKTLYDKLHKHGIAIDSFRSPADVVN